MAPNRLTLPRHHPRAVQMSLNGTRAKPSSRHLEHLLDNQHLRLVDNHLVTDGSVPETSWRLRTPEIFAFSCLANLPPPSPFGYLRPLILRQLVQDAVGELSFRALVPPII